MSVEQTPNVPAWQLLLNDHAFPKGWQVDPCTLSPRCFDQSEAVRTFGIVDAPGNVAQTVIRLASVDAAKAKYRTVYNVEFNKTPQPPHTPFLPVSEITYRSPIADEFFIGCGIDEIHACRSIFRYRNYYVEFYFDIDGGEGYGLQLGEVEPILRAMDERASSLLGVPFPSPSPR